MLPTPTRHFYGMENTVKKLVGLLLVVAIAAFVLSTPPFGGKLSGERLARSSELAS